jgi:hypothetical protein
MLGTASAVQVKGDAAAFAEARSDLARLKPRPTYAAPLTLAAIWHG